MTRKEWILQETVVLLNSISLPRSGKNLGEAISTFNTITTEARRRSNAVMLLCNSGQVKQAHSEYQELYEWLKSIGEVI